MTGKQPKSRKIFCNVCANVKQSTGALSIMVPSVIGPLERGEDNALVKSKPKSALTFCKKCLKQVTRKDKLSVIVAEHLRYIKSEESRIIT